MVSLFRKSSSLALGLGAVGLIFALCHLPLRAQQNFSSKVVTVDPSGAFTVGGVAFAVTNYDQSYLSINQGKPGAFTAAEGFPKETATSWETRGNFLAKNGETLILQERIEVTGDNSFRVTYHLESPSGAYPGLLTCVQGILPAETFVGRSIRVDDQEKPLLATPPPGQNLMFDKWGTKRLVVPVQGGTVTIEAENIKLHLQDDRPWNHSIFKFWHVLAKSGESAGPVDEALNFTFTPNP